MDPREEMMRQRGYGGGMSAAQPFPRPTMATNQPPQAQPVVNPAPVNPAPAFRNVGHDGNFNGMNREQWRDAWMGLGKVKATDADNWLRAHGAQAMPGKGDKWMTPFGEHYDLQIARGAANDGKNGGMIRAGWSGMRGGGGNGIPQGPAMQMPGQPMMPPLGSSIWRTLLNQQNAQNPDGAALRTVIGQGDSPQQY